MRIIVDYDKCTGLGMCEAEAPDLFAVQDDGSLEVLMGEPGEEHRAVAEAACEACPTEALTLVD
jgi:ferredoxin